MTARPGGLLRALRRQWLEPDYPLLAIELRARALGVVRLQRQGGRLSLAAAVAQELPEGVLQPSLTELNVLDPGALRAALRAALERAGAAAATRACLVLPDTAARVALLPATDLAGKRAAEAEDIVRFRLRKALPFDLREARLALPTGLGSHATGQAPVVVMARSVLEQYEAELGVLGLHVGLVELSSLVCLAAATHGRPASEDRVLANWDDGCLSLLLTRGGQLALVRTLALSGSFEAYAADVQREAFNTMLYYRERLGGTGLAGASLRAAALPVDAAVALLSEALEVLPEPLDPWSAYTRAGAGVADSVPGALVAPLAALLGRVA